MSSSEVAKIDGRGRLLIPQAFREVLNIKEGSNVLVFVNTEKKSLIVLPFAAAGDELYSLNIGLSDAPGSLMHVLEVLAKAGVDLVQSESLAADRGRMATYKAIVDLSKCKATPAQIRALLLKEKAATHASFERL